MNSDSSVTEVQLSAIAARSAFLKRGGRLIRGTNRNNGANGDDDQRQGGLTVKMVNSASSLQLLTTRDRPEPVALKERRRRSRRCGSASPTGSVANAQTLHRLRFRGQLVE